MFKAENGDVRCVCTMDRYNSKNFSNLCGKCYDPCSMQFQVIPLSFLKKEAEQATTTMSSVEETTTTTAL